MNLSWVPVLLSDIELFYTPPENIDNGNLVLTGEEYHHAINVMRKKVGEKLYITDGAGNIYITEIEKTEKRNVVARIAEKSTYPNKLQNFTLCIPRLKNPGRMEFALEKSVELGFTKFIVFESERTIAKGEKLKRWNKIVLSAMKQSLRSYLPKVEYIRDLSNVSKDFIKIVFNQNAEQPFASYLKSMEKGKNICLIFGPEGGFSEKEIKSFGNPVIVRLGNNRLRSETAVVTAASVLSNSIQS